MQSDTRGKMCISCEIHTGRWEDWVGKIGKFDAVITDPPYGISHPCNYKTRGRGRLAECNNYADVLGDNTPFDPQPLLDLGVPTVLWGANFYSNRLPPSSGWLVWDKQRPDTLDQATCELAWTNCVKGVRRFVHRWNGFIRASERGENYHPTQKPVALFDWVLSLKWLSGVSRVFDPFAGAGPVGVACAKAGIDYVGVEAVPEYADIARERIAKVLSK